MTELMPFGLVSAVVAAGLSTAICNWRPAWSIRRTTTIAALPLPMALTVFCAWSFVDAATSSSQECGVDACGMAMMFSVLGMGVALEGFVLGGIASAWVKRASGAS